MRIEVKLRIEAPPAVVFRFYTLLDHLRFVCPVRRHEWAVERGVVLALGRESEVRIEQRGHTATVRFRTARIQPGRFVEDHFVSWPVKGATHTVNLRPAAEDGRSTELHNVIAWDPPWYLLGLVERHEREQRTFFVERQENAKRLIEAVYALVGDEAFRDGIAEDAARAGFEPVADRRGPG